MSIFHREDEQLNNAPIVPSDMEETVDFTLDDIMTEFGSAAETPEVPAETPEVPAPDPTPIAETEAPAPDPAPRRESRKAENKRKRREETEEVAEEAPAEEEEPIRVWRPKKEIPPLPPEPPEPEMPGDEPETPRPRLHITRPPEKVEPTYPAPEDACRAYGKKTASLRLRLTFAWLGTAASAAATAILATPAWGLAAHIPVSLYNAACLGVLLLIAVLCFPILTDGVGQILRGRFSLKSYLAILTVVTVLYTFLSLGDGAMCLCAPASLLLTIALWSEGQLCAAKHKSLRAVLAMDAPMAAARYKDVWHGQDCLYRAEARTDHFVRDLEQSPATARFEHIFAPLMAALTLAVSVVISVRSERDFLWVWTILLLGAFPLGACLSYARPFAVTARRLGKSGAAVAGWYGASQLGGSGGIVITDGDLFPRANVTMNGMKVFGSASAAQVLGYAAAVVQTSGAELSRVFEQALEMQNGRHYHTDNFRVYEAGGLGAEIGGDIVLLGHLGFMQVMGVHMPENTKIRQAVYISVNGEAVGVFAINYTPSDAVRSGLAAILYSRGLTPILATRDFLLTPAMVRARYKLPADRLEYPVYRERERLSAAKDAEGGSQGAFLARGSFMSFATAIAGSRSLLGAGKFCAFLGTVAALLGLGLMTLLAFLGAADAASAANLLLYHAIWMIPTLLVTTSIRK